MGRLLLLGLSLLHRAGAWLRLRRSCWSGLPTPFKLSWPSWGHPGHPGGTLDTFFRGEGSRCPSFL
eukprot:1857891-Pyramimonas_sp.AAC.1